MSKYKGTEKEIHFSSPPRKSQSKLPEIDERNAASKGHAMGL